MISTHTQEKDETSPEADESSDLPPKKEAALQALLLHQTTKEVARTSGISEITLWRSMQDEAFSRRLR